MQLLDFIPDFSSWDEAGDWIKKGQNLVVQKNDKIASLEWNECQEKGSTSFGLYSSKAWRKFALATFLADLVSYPTPGDQVNFDRLLFVMHAFPEGFRVWWTEQEGVWWPVGYTGWYPMLETSFKIFEKEPEKIKNRMVVPNPSSDPQKPLYLFNFSVIPSLKKSPLSHELMKRFVEDINAQNPSGLTCITVSPEGQHIARRFGMSITGQMDGEGVWCYNSSQSKA